MKVILNFGKNVEFVKYFENYILWKTKFLNFERIGLVHTWQVSSRLVLTDSEGRRFRPSRWWFGSSVQEPV